MIPSGPWESDSGSRQPESCYVKKIFVRVNQLASTAGRISTAPHSLRTEGGPAATSYSKRGITPTVKGFSELTHVLGANQLQFHGALLPLHHETITVEIKTMGTPIDAPA